MVHQCKIIPFKRKLKVMEIINRILNISCISLCVACIAVNVFALCCVFLIGG